MPELNWTEDEIYLVAARAYALYLQGCYREAAILFEGLVEVAPTDWYCRTALAAMALALEDPALAVEQLTAVLERNPRDREARARRSEAWCQMGRIEDARRDLEALRRADDRTHVRRLQWRIEAAASNAREFSNFLPPRTIT